MLQVTPDKHRVIYYEIHEVKGQINYRNLHYRMIESRSVYCLNTRLNLGALLMLILEDNYCHIGNHLQKELHS
jgi:hypothetical protein